MVPAMAEKMNGMQKGIIYPTSTKREDRFLIQLCVCAHACQPLHTKDLPRATRERTLQLKWLSEREGESVKAKTVKEKENWR